MHNESSRCVKKTALSPWRLRKCVGDLAYLLPVRVVQLCSVELDRCKRNEDSNIITALSSVQSNAG